jgi:hypothetical protein
MGVSTHSNAALPAHVQKALRDEAFFGRLSAQINFMCGVLALLLAV